MQQSSLEVEEASIALAVKMLQKHIVRMIQKKSSIPHQRSNNNNTAIVSSSSSLLPPPNNVQRLLDHTQHLLLDLVRKRCSLQAFLTWFHGEWVRIEGHLQQQQDCCVVVPILQHAMQQYLRCQDGLVLLTSGECRHASDIQQAQQQTQQQSVQKKKKRMFVSRLPSLKERHDGYTKLYAGEWYSGTGWDEFHNDQVGIKVLLQQTLQKFHKSPWEYLEHKGALDLLESVWDHHESKVKEIQQQLQALKQRMLTDIQQRLQPRNLKFATQDKMERLSLIVVRKTQQQQTIDLQRRGNAFQIQGPVLPLSKQRPEDWNVLALNLHDVTKAAATTSNTCTDNDNNVPPSNDNRKRRRRLLVVESSDDSSEGEENSVVQGNNALRQKNSVSTKRYKDNKTANNASAAKEVEAAEAVSSNNDVDKTQGLVVSVKETSSTPLSSESNDDVLALNVIKTQCGVNARELEDARESLEVEGTIHNQRRRSFEEEKVLRLKQVLQRALSRSESDDDEIWDARECLRLAHMEAGNHLLWETETQQGAEKARAHFEAAKALVEEQQKAHHDMKHRTDFDATTWEFLSRNLFYLQGQATVNVGIAMIESLKTVAAKNEGKLLKAIPKLQAAIECASKMRSKIRPDMSCSLEEAQDVLKAHQLESLSRRWIGKAQWMAHQESRAIDTLQAAAFLINGDKVGTFYAGLEDDVLDLAAECLYAFHMVVDVVCSQLEGLSRSSVAKGDALVEIVKQTSQKHNSVMDVMKQHYDNEHLEQFLLEKDLPTSDEITIHLNTVTKWWGDLKEKRNGPFRANTINRQLQSSSRADLSSTGSSNIQMMSNRPEDYQSTPSWAHSRQFRKRPKPSTNGSYPKNPLHSLLQTHPSKTSDVRANPPPKYRPWGDELFWLYYEQKHGKVEDKSLLPYPSCAPPMPEEFQQMM